MSNETTTTATTPEHTPLGVGLRAMRSGRAFLKRMLEQTPDELYFKPPIPGANHPAWVVGHLASTDDFVLMQLSGRSSMLPPAWAELFQGGSTCHPGPEKYPSREELERKLDETRAALESWYASRSEEQLVAAIEGELGMFIPTYSAIGPSCSFHDAFHAAQISMTRRGAGLAPLF